MKTGRETEDGRPEPKGKYVPSGSGPPSPVSRPRLYFIVKGVIHAPPN